MSGKKRFIVLAGGALVAFGLAFGTMFFLSEQPEAPADPNAADKLLSPDTAVGKLETLTPSERQLKELIRQVRKKIEDYEAKQRQLEAADQRLKMARADLEAQAKELEDLRLGLVGPLTELREARMALEKTRITIEQDERQHLREMAAVFERMDAPSGASTLESMCSNQQHNDVAKILNYMEDRSAAKLLAEISDKAIVADLIDRIKRLREG